MIDFYHYYVYLKLLQSYNIRSGQVVADCLFNHKIIDHYRYEK